MPRDDNYIGLLQFVAFFQVSSLSKEADNKKVGIDNEKVLEMDNRIICSYFNIETSPKNATKHPVVSGMIR